MTASDSLLTAPDDAPERTPPDAALESLDAACELAVQLMSSHLALASERYNGPFEDQFRGSPRVGCRITAAGLFSELPAGVGSPDGDLMNAYRALGWRHDLQYSADGPEGGLVGMRHEELLCIVRAQWNGGLDAQDEFTPEELDQYQLWIECAVDRSPAVFSQFD